MRLQRPGSGACILLATLLLTPRFLAEIPPGKNPGAQNAADSLRQLLSLPATPKLPVNAWKKEVAPLLEKILNTPELSSEDKSTALLAATDSCPDEVIQDLIESIANFCREHPDESLRPNLEIRRVLLLDKVNPNGAAVKLQALATDANEKVSSVAQGELRRRALKASPLDLRFTASDGREVDLTAWRGKAVLIDIWATWCAPCVKEMPEIVAAYRKYHPVGLEVVEISLDKDKTELETFVRQKSIPWPQYFQGSSPRNEFIDRFGITGIPQMWLLDKQGLIESFNVREHVTEELERLLSPK